MARGFIPAGPRSGPSFGSGKTGLLRSPAGINPLATDNPSPQSLLLIRCALSAVRSCLLLRCCRESTGQSSRPLRPVGGHTHWC
ncbi:hypothetical protein EVS84_20870 [Pseudomonas koreensis]|uniref:Uncharacterized protein n=1 Tax=Pseudomonas koreensis TaxID=198620 RepID=A0A4Q4KYA7_9PSED|nr:hypothetical protein EVS84_20870 [Pseudomonas koreensis]